MDGLRHKVILAPNSFKECLSAAHVADAMREGVMRALAGSHVEIVSVPVADGGDGTLDVLVSAQHGILISATVKDPLFRDINAEYALINQPQLLLDNLFKTSPSPSSSSSSPSSSSSSSTTSSSSSSSSSAISSTSSSSSSSSSVPKVAVIEMARSSGLSLLQKEEQDPLNTTTYGFGQLLQLALQNREVSVIVCTIGGSATNDGGIGMAAALGFKFYDADGGLLSPIGRSLALINRIDSSGVDWSRLLSVPIYVACDVTNPLLGKNGASTVYAPQKGASPQAVQTLEKGMTRLSELWSSQLDRHVAAIPGAGAAGGLGAGLMAFCRAHLVSGFDLVAHMVELEDKLRGATLVITGEGRIDASTAAGKVPHGVARFVRRAAQSAIVRQPVLDSTDARGDLVPPLKRPRSVDDSKDAPLRVSIPCIALCGSVDTAGGDYSNAGLTAVFSIASGPLSLDYSKQHAAELIAFTTEQIVRLYAGCVSIAS